MVTVLIPTILEDIHAAAVSLALERLGHRPVRWFCTDFPELSTSSFTTGTRAPELLQISDHFGTVDLGEVDVFWNRRIGQPTVRSPLPESDKQVALREAKIYLDGLVASASDLAFSVNGYNQARLAENKLVQLRAARRVGFDLPETLISNNPRQIRKFLARHDERGAIFKSFKPVTWEADDKLAIAFTSRVSRDMLPDDAILRLSLGIFQSYVPKAFEVRVTCMGREAVAVRLQSQKTEHGRDDWRLAASEEMAIEAIELPLETRNMCFSLLDRLGLLFGCFDFIVTDEGRYVFLEVNQMGQFLWIEAANPGIPLLQTFTEFLLSRDPGFARTSTDGRISFQEIGTEAEALIEADRSVHRRPERYSHIFRE